MNPVIEFYQRSNEHSRTTNTPLEFLRNKEIILRSLPPGPCRVLDVGGATGAYSFWLASLGHRVTLVDLTPKHIEKALSLQAEASAPLEAAQVADALDLPFDDGGFDAVLLMGPLYHLQDRDRRIQALREARRVVHPGGVLVAVAIGRYASLVDGFHDHLVSDPEFVAIMRRDVETGLHQDTSRGQGYFTDAYLHLPDDLSAEVVAAGWSRPQLLAVTSFGWTIPGIEKKLEDEGYRDLLLEMLRRVEDRPELLGVSSHIAAVSRG